MKIPVGQIHEVLKQAKRQDLTVKSRMGRIVMDRLQVSNMKAALLRY